MFGIRKFDLLVALYIFFITASELMGSKVVPFFQIGGMKFNASVAIFTFPFIFTINDIVTEVFGKERTRSLIRSALVVVFLIFVFSAIAISLPSAPRTLQQEPAYDVIFGKSMRFAAASLVAFALAEFLDLFIFSKIRERLGKKNLWLRNNVSNFSAQFIDTVIFMTLAFYALETSLQSNVSFLWSIILPYWLVKCLMSVIETPFVYLGVAWFKKEKNT